MKQAEYKALRNEAKRCITRIQAEVMKEQAETLDSKEGRQNIFRIAKQKKKERKDITGTKCLKGDNGELLVSEEQVSGRWREYIEKLLNEENEWNDELSAEYVEGPADMISKEVRQAIQDLKVRKAAGPSGVTGEMIKAAGELVVDWLTSICNRIVKEEAIPESWQMSELVPIYKGKGDVLECSSSRGIKLLQHGMKVAERVLERRLRQAVEIDKMQFGFRPGTGTTHAIFIARQLQERYRGKHRELWWAFVDLEKAFDRVPRKVVEWAMRKLSVEEWLVRAVMAMYKHARTRIRSYGG